MQGNCSTPRPEGSKLYDQFIDVSAIGSNACSILAREDDYEFTDYDDYQNDPNVAICGRVWLSNLVITSPAFHAGFIAYFAQTELHIVNTVIAGFNRAVKSDYGSMYVIGASFHEVLLNCCLFRNQINENDSFLKHIET